MWAYRLLRAFLRIAVRVFYRQVEVVGLENVPVEGPVIFAGNHPNSLIDPVLLVATCGRVVQFAAKDTLFESRLLRVFLKALGAVPIRRKMDHPSTRPAASLGVNSESLPRASEASRGISPVC